MVRESQSVAAARVGVAKRASAGGTLFGIPMGDLGWFTSLIMGLAIGFVAFFIATFVAIVGMLIYSTATHHEVNYAWTYARFGLPIGIVSWALALGYLGMNWVRRKLRRA